MKYKIGQYITFKRNDVFYKATLLDYRGELDMFYVLLDNGCEVAVMPHEIVTPYNSHDDITDAYRWFGNEKWIGFKNETKETIHDGFFLQETVKDVLDTIEDYYNKERLDYTLFPNYEFEFPIPSSNFDIPKVRTIYYSKLPKNVFFNDKKKATTLMFPNQNATVVKCGKDDEYSRRVGFLEAYFQATCGLSKTKAKKYLQDIVKDKEK